MADKRQNLSTQIYESLLAKLHRGEIAVGERLVDVGLAAELGVSRMPVRDALNLLAHEGYLDSTSRGFVLATVSAEDAMEIFEMRKLLEPRAVASATLRLDAAAIESLDALHASAERAVTGNNVEAFMDAIREFRSIWIDAIPNHRLAASVRRTLAQIDVIQRISFTDPTSRLIVYASLTELLHALRDRDALAAHDIVAALIERGRDVFTAMRARPLTERVEGADK